MKAIPILLLFVLFGACDPQTNEPKNTPSKNEITPSSIDPISFIGKDYFVDDQHSYIGFKIKYFGFSPVRGRFNNFDGTLRYDPSDITGLSVTVFVDVHSINTGNERRDNDLKREGAWFDVNHYPVISFSSTTVIPKAEGAFDLVGNLSIKGISKLDTISFEKPTALSRDWAGNYQVDFTGKTTLNRQEFEVFGGDFWSSVMENGLTQLSDEVDIEIDIHARRGDYQVRYDDADSTDLSKRVLDRIKTFGINAGIEQIDSLFAIEQLSSGKLSTIGYTLNSWGMHKEALAVFNKRLGYYPEKINTRNQLGITHLFMKNHDEAVYNFSTTLKADSTNSRAYEYLRLIGLLN